MTLEECYTALDGDYADVISRLRSEKLVQKFALKFLNDDNFNLLCHSLEEKQYEEAFRAAHTIKGVCQNLSFTRLLHSSDQLTEALRSGWTPEVEALFQQTSADYHQTVDAILKFKSENENL